MYWWFMYASKYIKSSKKKIEFTEISAGKQVNITGETKEKKYCQKYQLKLCCW